MPALSLDQRTLPRVRVRRWIFEEAFSNLATAHEGCEVCWCYEGILEYRIERGEVLRLRPGSAIVVAPLFEHATGIGACGRADSLLLPTDVVRSAAESARRRVVGARLVVGTPERPAPLAALGDRLDRAVWGDAPASTIDTLVDEILAKVVETGEPIERRAHDVRIQRAVEFIGERYAESLSLDDLAKSAKMSRYHFSRVFRAVTGKAPHRYLLEVRLARAAELLRARRCTVTEAASRVGCHDIGRFGRMFRQVHGVRPSEYLARCEVQGGAVR